MLNLLAEDDFWVNDLWRLAKDFDYYKGYIYTIKDRMHDLLCDRSPKMEKFEQF